MKTILVGLGNPILGDDGVGWKVVEEVQKRLPPNPAVDIQCLSLGGLGLMEHLIGYQRAILVDAFASEDQPGSVMTLKLNDLPNYSAFHTNNAHDTSLQSAIELGRAMGASLPEEVEIVGVVTLRIHDFSEELSPPVAEAVSFAAQLVLDLLLEQTVDAGKAGRIVG